MTHRLRNIGIAVALAVVAALLVSFYVTNYKRHVQRSEEQVTVYVAARDIPVGTSGSTVVERHMLSTRSVARRAVVPGAVSSPHQVENKIATQPVYAGEQVTTRRFGQPSERGVRSQLHGNQRALQIPGDSNQLLAGTLRAGDHVDVVANWEWPEGSSHHVTRVVLRDLLVLRAASAKDTAEKLSTTSAPLNVQLRITDNQSQKLFWEHKNGDWWLELRPPVRSADSPEGVETSDTLLADGFTLRGLKKALNPFGGRLR